MTAGDARSARRRATAHRIELAAVEAALELGFDRVTVEEICARSDVARSTFFTHFPARDAAVLGLPVELLDGDAATRVLDGAAGDPPLAVHRFVVASTLARGDDPDFIRARARLVTEQREAHVASTAMLTDVGERIMVVLAEWLAAHPEHARIPEAPAVEASLAANAYYAAISTIPGGWMATLVDPEGSAQLIRAALDDLGRVLVR